MGEINIKINCLLLLCSILLQPILIFHLSFPLRCSADITLTKERTLAMIKPDGFVGNHTNFIQQTILASGFTILNQITLQLDPDTAKQFYADHSSTSFFPSLINYITSGPVLIMVLEKVNAVSEWRSLIGPTDASKAKVTHPHSIRAMCGVSLERNCVHGSDSTKSAAREISFFFKETNPGENVSEHDEL
ncbi:putative nucleoside diphosphate kinase 5 [Apium graveolens]|uniref:putative nucleoside diphosphate kinase 5 n=1 Tax=Apium graveolens TaxID=4045 RepID=UPI003D7AB288